MFEKEITELFSIRDETLNIVQETRSILPATSLDLGLTALEEEYSFPEQLETDNTDNLLYINDIYLNLLHFSVIFIFLIVFFKLAKFDNP